MRLTKQSESQPPTLAQPARGGEEGESTRVRAATICQRCRFHKPGWADCGEHHCPEWPARESICEANAPPMTLEELQPPTLSELRNSLAQIHTAPLRMVRAKRYERDMEAALGIIDELDGRVTVAEGKLALLKMQVAMKRHPVLLDGEEETDA